MSILSGATLVKELTVEEFRGLFEITKQQTQLETVTHSNNEPKFIYGIKGLAKFLGCTPQTAQKIKNSGRISYVQVERTIVFEKQKILVELSNEKSV
jgi:hypothetical protein